MENIEQVAFSLQNSINNGDFDEALRLSQIYFTMNPPCKLVIQNQHPQVLNFPQDQYSESTISIDSTRTIRGNEVVAEEQKNVKNEKIYKLLRDKGVSENKARFAATNVNTLEEARAKLAQYTGK